MYPNPPQSQQTTANYWILAVCVAAMLIVLLAGLRSVAGRFNAAASSMAAGQSSTAPRASISLAPQVSASAASVVPAQVSPTPSAVVDVDARILTESPAAYRGRPVRVSGTVFYSGKLADGHTWIQIVGSDNVYVDGSSPDPLPAGVSKGSQVQITGMGAGLTNITASNGSDYDQAYIDPVQKIELIR